MTLRLFCKEFCRIKFLNMFKIFATTLRHLATHARILRITGDCFKTVLRLTRDVCRRLSQNSRSPVREGLELAKIYTNQTSVTLYKSDISHMTKITAMPIYGKNPLKNLQNQKAGDLGTWDVALGMWGLPSLFK